MEDFCIELSHIKKTNDRIQLIVKHGPCRFMNLVLPPFHACGSINLQKSDLSLILFSQKLEGLFV